MTAEPLPDTADAIDAELRAVVARRAGLVERADALIRRRDALFLAGRALDPPMSYASMARAAGVSDVAVINACKRLTDG